MATGSIHFIPQRDKGKSLPTLSPRRLRPLTPLSALFHPTFECLDALFQPTFVYLNTLFQGSLLKNGDFS